MSYTREEKMRALSRCKNCLTQARAPKIGERVVARTYTSQSISHLNTYTVKDVRWGQIQVKNDENELKWVAADVFFFEDDIPEAFASIARGEIRRRSRGSREYTRVNVTSKMQTVEVMLYVDEFEFKISHGRSHLEIRHNLDDGTNFFAELPSFSYTTKMLDALASYVIFDDDLNASSDIKLTVQLSLERYATSDALAHAILKAKKTLLDSLPDALHELESVIDPDDIYNIERFTNLKQNIPTFIRF
ncbi:MULTISPECIES: hypothetical protein [unclassified Exiguobacterium]|uniref:hypothetical protein n=1 Tax=unclassified Exiguobacterium TaxID=2644629 RepID=UPI001BE5BC85|nr:MULTISPECIES: hypothetical protein [unclassified Exiguobacterium]